MIGAVLHFGAFKAPPDFDPLPQATGARVQKLVADAEDDSHPGT
jgi:hypothetical protein